MKSTMLGVTVCGLVKRNYDKSHDQRGSRLMQSAAFLSRICRRHRVFLQLHPSSGCSSNSSSSFSLLPLLSLLINCHQCHRVSQTAQAFHRATCFDTCVFSETDETWHRSSDKSDETQTLGGHNYDVNLTLTSRRILRILRVNMRWTYAVYLRQLMHKSTTI